MKCQKCNGLMVVEKGYDMSDGTVGYAWRCLNCSNNVLVGPVQVMASPRTVKKASCVPVPPARADPKWNGRGNRSDRLTTAFTELTDDVKRRRLMRHDGAPRRAQTFVVRLDHVRDLSCLAVELGCPSKHLIDEAMCDLLDKYARRARAMLAAQAGKECHATRAAR